MTETRWWHVAVIVTAIVLSALLFLEQVPPSHLYGALAANAALVVVWFTVGRGAHHSERRGIVLVALVIAIATIAVGFDSSMATIQCLVFPIIWTVLAHTRAAIVANVVLAVAIAGAFYVGLGATTHSLILGLIIEGISLAFSLALGIWITSIADRSDERQRLIDELEAANSKLAVLSRDAGAAGERERLAREIHDTIAQDLTGLVLTAQRGRRELGAGNLEEAASQLAILEENARNALAETRALVASGAAVGVDGSGLATALERLGLRFERETGITVTMTASGEAGVLDRDGEVVLLRCAQEALANVRKHSRATAASLVLTATGTTLSLTVTDDGVGFDAAHPTTGFGLEGMRERLSLVNGTLGVAPGPAGGTTLTATLPSAAVATVSAVTT